MNSKQRISVIFSMLSLTVLMLCFQNCSQGPGSEDLESDTGIINPPIVLASKNSNCTQPSVDFKLAETIFICVQNAGPAPKYCHTRVGYSNCTYEENIATATGWTSVSGNWVKGFNAATIFQYAGTYISYGIHTDDATAFGQTTFNVTQ